MPAVNQPGERLPAMTTGIRRFGGTAFRAGWPALLLALGLCACATPPQVVLTGDIRVDGPNAIAHGPPRDKLLWQYRTALAELRLGHYAEAKRILDDAVLTLQGIYGKDPEARKARGFFSPESRKNFIGEPYERSMAYIYLGVLYWADGQLDNARACFRSAEFEDSDTADRQYAGDWVLPDYLDGLATAKLGGDGSDAFKRAQAHSRNIKLPPYKPNANLLFIVEFGPGPLKFSSGPYGEELRFRTRPSPVFSARLKTDGIDQLVAPCDDLNFQATTRGGRVMDHVLANKAVFKTATGVAGSAAMIGGLTTAAVSHDRTTQTVGLGIAAAGLVSSIISAATTPEADVRTWDNLPQFISFASVSLPPGPHTVSVEFLDRAGNPLPQFTKTFTVNVAATDRNKVVFVSDQSASPQVF
jgi:hypothetical protein